MYLLKSLRIAIRTTGPALGNWRPCSSGVLILPFPFPSPYPFAQFSLAGISLTFVPMFKYLGHIIDNKLKDDADVCRELKCLFTRTNILIRRFLRCSSEVKIRLFKSFCVCFYDIALWRHVKVAVLNKLRSAYVFFNFPKYSSVTDMLIRRGLPSFSTISHNAEWTFMIQSSICNNRLVSILRDICMHNY